MRDHKSGNHAKYWRALDLSTNRIRIIHKSGEYPAIKAMPVTPDILERVRTILGFPKITGGYVVDLGHAAFFMSRKALMAKYDIVDPDG